MVPTKLAIPSTVPMEILLQIIKDLKCTKAQAVLYYLTHLIDITCNNHQENDWYKIYNHDGINYVFKRL